MRGVPLDLDRTPVPRRHLHPEAVPVPHERRAVRHRLAVGRLRRAVHVRHQMPLRHEKPPATRQARERERSPHEPQHVPPCRRRGDLPIRELVIKPAAQLVPARQLVEGLPGTALPGEAAADRVEVHGRPYRWQIAQSASSAVFTPYSFTRRLPAASSVTFGRLIPSAHRRSSAIQRRFRLDLPVQIEHLLARRDRRRGPRQITVRMSVAFEAPHHRELARLVGEGHLLQRPVAHVARDPPRHVDRVVEVHELRQIVHPRPHDGPPLRPTPAHRLQKRAVPPYDAVARHARLRRRNPRVRRGLHARVAVAAVQPQLAHVVPMAELHRLLPRLVHLRVQGRVAVEREPRDQKHRHHRPQKERPLKQGVRERAEKSRHPGGVSSRGSCAWSSPPERLAGNSMRHFSHFMGGICKLSGKKEAFGRASDEMSILSGSPRR